jgi:CubicO group peptidase (beta-lactamase class C family)
VASHALELEAAVRERVRAVQREQRLPSLTVAVGRAGRTVFAASAGLADVPAGRRAGPATPYRIGSITKTFTAALVLLLAERGVLDVDEPVARYLPAAGGARDGAGRARLRQLLAHCGGVQREVPLPMWTTLDGPAADELLAALPNAELVGRPGERHHYSNLGYAVLGQVVQAVIGSRCEDLVDRELLAPLRLRATSWREPVGAATGYRLDPYTDGVHVEPVMDLRALGVGGQLWSTAEDLLAWADALSGGAPHVVPGTVAATMRTPHVMVDRAAWTQGWGLGLVLDRHGDRVFAGHTGAMPGHLAALTFDAATRTAVVALTNATRGVRLPPLAADTLAEALRLLPDEAEPAAWTPDPAPDDVAGALGRWWCEGEEHVVAWRDGTLCAWLATDPDASFTRFAPDGPNRYRTVEGRLTGEVLLVKRGPDGRVTQLEWATYPFTRTPREYLG